MAKKTKPAARAVPITRTSKAAKTKPAVAKPAKPVARAKPVIIVQPSKRVKAAPSAKSAKNSNGAVGVVPQITPREFETSLKPVVVRPHPEDHARQPYDGDTAIKLYLREIAQTPLITVQEEITLAARIKRGDKAAAEHMIKANLRFVVKISRDYDGLGLPLLDLINEGNMGLMKAVARFDPAKGGKLSTYAAWWIKQSIKRALANQSKTIRLPVHLVDKISKMRYAAMKLQEMFGREPTDDELAHELGMTSARVTQLRTAAIRPASLDAPVGDDENSDTLGDLVEDEHAHTPYQDLEEKTVTAMLREMVAMLSPREEDILRFRFGLDGGTEKTLEDVGARFGVTRERVRQIQNIALLRLRKMISLLERVRE
ncbi:MAG: RNA polymerase sigma factor RpoD/SigA [Pedosphaera sp.]|nr:RNA polymerase sigma factor RpoD/SigA [Pedosphaera sp.]